MPRESGPCLGCHTVTNTAVAFRGNVDWLTAALGVIMDEDDDFEEAFNLVTLMLERQEQTRKTSGSVRRNEPVRPLQENQPGWHQITVGACQACASRGHWIVKRGPDLNCYLPPTLPEDAN